MRNILTIAHFTLLSLVLLRNLVGAQNDDTRVLEVISAAPKLDLQRSEFILKPPLGVTSPTVDRAVSCVAVDRQGSVHDPARSAEADYCRRSHGQGGGVVGRRPIQDSAQHSHRS